jgi:hypothetical protein
MGLLLHHNRPRGYGLALTNVSHLELYEIAGTEFAVDGEIEQGEFPATAGELQPNANSPYLFQLEGGLLPTILPLFQGGRAVEVVSLDSMIGSCVDGANKSAPRPNGARRPSAAARDRRLRGRAISATASSQ